MDEREAVDLYGAALQNLDAAVMITGSPPESGELRIVYVNAGWVELTGYAPEEVLGHSPRFLSDSDFVSRLIQEAEASEQGDQYMRTEAVAKRKDGTHLRVAVSVTRMQENKVGDQVGGNSRRMVVERENAPYFVVVLRDISRQQALMSRMRRLEVLTHLQREVASTGLDLDARRQKVAEVAMTVTGAESAVVEEVEGDEMVYYAVAGDACGQQGLRLPIQQSISGLAYMDRTPQLVRDVVYDKRVVLKEEAQRVGFRSGVLAPLIYENRTYGVLKVLSTEPDRFGEEQRLLLELASGVLAASLSNAREYRNELERRGFLLDALPVYVSYIDQQHRYQEVNTVYESLFGLAAESIRGQYVWDVLGVDGYGRIRPYLEAAFRGERVSYEMEVPLPNGEEQVLSGDYVPNRDVSGEVTGIYTIVRDVTDARLAHSDYLTGLRNRREFEEQGRNLLAVARRYNTALSVVMLDIDQFKAINDTQGHLAGDAILRELAALLGESLRESDVIGRWGGDEFIFLLPYSDIESMEQMAMRLSRTVQEHQFSAVDRVTVSCGGVALAPDEGLQSLVARADTALYEAKRQGGNCVHVAK